VHRDVSPGNVLLGRAEKIKLADFGIVRSEFVDRRTYPGELKGNGLLYVSRTVDGQRMSIRAAISSRSASSWPKCCSLGRCFPGKMNSRF